MARRLTVLQVLPALQSGGVERGTLEVAAEVVRRGHRALVISAGGRMVGELEASGAEHVSWDIGRKSLATFRLVPRLRRLLREEHVDILHPRSRLPAWIAFLAWRGMDPNDRPRLVTTVHGFYSVGRYSAVMTRGERVIAVSESVRRYILDNYPRVDPGRIQVIHRGVDPVAFPYGYIPDEPWWQCWFGEYPMLKNRKVITLAGRITRLKGHADLIDLMVELRRGGDDICALAVGGEHPRRKRYAQELRHRVADAGLEKNILFTGQRADVREILAVSDLVVSLSRQPESFGRTVMEALSLGVPVVGYDHGGVGEILEAVYPSGRVQPGDRAALRAAVERHLAQPPAVPADHPFHLDRMLAQTLELYESLVRGAAAAVVGD